jgi:hypothetical protein
MQRVLRRQKTLPPLSPGVGVFAKEAEGLRFEQITETRCWKDTQMHMVN